MFPGRGAVSQLIRENGMTGNNTKEDERKNSIEDQFVGDYVSQKTFIWQAARNRLFLIWSCFISRLR